LKKGDEMSKQRKKRNAEVDDDDDEEDHGITEADVNLGVISSALERGMPHLEDVSDADEEGITRLASLLRTATQKLRSARRARE
jgi:hypothetical protein